MAAAEVNTALPMMSEGDLHRAKIRMWNGFGLQAPSGGEDQEYVVCLINFINGSNTSWRTSLDENALSQIVNESGASSLRQYESYSTSCLKIHWSQCELIPTVLSMVIELGFNFQLCIKTLPQFGPRQGDTFFSWDMVEDRIISNAEAFLAVPGNSNIVLENPDKWSLFNLWNWTSPRGKAFCRKIRLLNGMEPQDEELDDDNYFHWKQWTDYVEWKAAQDEKDQTRLTRLTRQTS